jgi:hypothetical protein
MSNRLRTAGSILKDAASKMGTDLRSLDEAYSDKISQMYEGKGPIAQTIGYTVGGATPSFSRLEVDGPDGVLKSAVQYGVPAANAVSKYVLPGVGVTLAGQALMDAARALQGGQQTEATLGVDAGQVTMSALVGGGLAAGPGLVEAMRAPVGTQGPGRGKIAGMAAAGAGAMAGVNVALQSLGL